MPRAPLGPPLPQGAVPRHGYACGRPRANTLAPAGECLSRPVLCSASVCHAGEALS